MGELAFPDLCNVGELGEKATHRLFPVGALLDL